MNDLIITLESKKSIDLIASDSISDLELTLGESSQYPVYHGATTFTPTQEAQIAFTAGKVVLQDIHINPIPYNYGLVTYQGNIITIS